MRRRRDPPTSIEVRGARVNNLKDLSIDVPLGRFVALTGVSGSGKSSLAMGVLYAEGSRRYLDGLPTFTRRRITQAIAPDVDSVGYVPAALSLRQRPPMPGPRSTVGTMTEVNAVARLTMSRLGTHPCPNGHPVPPSLDAWATEQITCPICGAIAPLPSAESFAFNTHGACRTCEGLGATKEVDADRLIVDDDLTLTDGAIGPWRMLGRSHMPLVAAELGVRTDVPWRDLTAQEKRLVIEGPGHPVTKHIVVQSGAGRPFPLNTRYESATESVRKMAGKETASGRTGAERYLETGVCPACHGTRLSPVARASRLARRDLAEILATPLSDHAEFAAAIVAEATATSPSLMPTAERLTDELRKAVEPLLALGLGYLSPDRAGDTLSTGERQRIQLQSTAMRRSTGMLYVLDEPSIGLHASAVEGLIEILDGLVADGNSLVVVDHDVQILRDSDQLVELGPDAGADGGRLIAQGPPAAVAATPESRIGPYLTGAAQVTVRRRRAPDPDLETVTIDVSQLFNLSDVQAQFPVNRMTAVTGVSGAGKTALILDALVPALVSATRGEPLPRHVRDVNPAGIDRVVVVDATPIGANDRSTPATYSGAFDEIRTLFATTDAARERGWNKGRFS
jgi:excinuclease ABC subunit A